MTNRLVPLLVLVGIGLATSAFGDPGIDDAANDENLSTVAQRALDARESLAATEVSVAVNDGTAVLKGRVALLRDSWLAEEVVAEVPGIRSIDNQLKIDLRGRGDSQIGDELRQRIAADPALAAAGVRIELMDGRVVFSGAIPDARLRFAVRRLAGDIEDVVAFEDRLQSPAASDDAIEREATALLAPGVLTGSPGPIGVDVASGSVTLSGVVRTVAARRLAEKRVWGINGVGSVVNGIRVERAP